MLPLVSVGTILLSLLYVIIRTFELYPTATIVQRQLMVQWQYGSLALDLAGLGIAIWLLFNSNQSSYILGGKRLLLFIIVCSSILAIVQGYWLVSPHLQTAS